MGSRTPRGHTAPMEPPLLSVLPTRVLARRSPLLSIPQKFLEFVQREEACEGLRVLMIAVALLRCLEEKLVQAESSLEDVSASSTFSRVMKLWGVPER